jgi:RND family efflux transporter MFP subunit
VLALPENSSAGSDGLQPVLKLVAVSGTAGFEARTNLLAAAREALQEAADSGRSEQSPLPGDEQSPAGSTASPLAASPLADYRQEAQAVAVLALPLQVRGQAVGALLLEFDQPPAAATVALAQTAALALAPALALHTRAARSLPRHVREATGGALRALVGPSRPGLKAASLLGAGLLLAAALWPLPFRVGAPATVEGRVQRAAVAPFAGYILESSVRAGDTVRAGDLLARLDDRELRLEEARWQAQAEVADRRAREALARGAAVAVQLARAEADEAEAQLALTRSRLVRAAVTAPFDGVVLRGDLSQQLGAPVEQGSVLFEVAPLDSWRVVLKVDERDVLRVQDGAVGELVLSGLPGVRHTLRVRQVAPVAVAEDGRNAFRVEAEVTDPSPLIQPGMQGVGKVLVGERSALYIATHRLMDWLRFTAWSWGL